MGFIGGDVDGELSDKENAMVTEALLKSLARRDGVPYTPPSDEVKLPPETSRRHRVETGD